MAAAVAPGASASASGKSGKSAGGICDEDPLFKAAALGAVMKKLRFNLLRFVNAENAGEDIVLNAAELQALKALVGDKFHTDLMAYEVRYGDNDEAVEPVEFIGFLTVYYQGVCANDLLEIWNAVPVPDGLVGRRGQGPTR